MKLKSAFYQAAFLHEQEKTSREKFTDFQNERSFEVEIKKFFIFLGTFTKVNKTNFYGGGESEFKDYCHKVNVVNPILAILTDLFFL